ncbi:MAG: nucleoside-diphosphate sugar epimerase/dehydratase [Mariprofundales bacterium]|nr:nucleoside-diphosphate sugar epimerase/dehydratase [Mariprofundales bacterium]
MINRSQHGLWRSRWMAVIHDLLWIPVALLFAFWLRFNLEMIPVNYMVALGQLVLLALPLQGAVFWYLGLYRGIWRFASLPDLLRILQAVLIGSALVFVADFIWLRLVDVPRSVLLLYPMLLAVGLAAPRMLYRWHKDHRMVLEIDQRQRALIIGAGDAGELLARDLLKNQRYQPIGFLDDDPAKAGLEIHGVRVLGSTEMLGKVAQKLALDVVLLALPSASAKVINRLLMLATEHQVPCRTVPSLPELAAGTVEIGALRAVNIEDLLGRDEIGMNPELVRAAIRGRCVLVTGAGGSIGSELCRQIASFSPRQLLLLDHGEFNLYRIEQELRNPDLALVPLLGDIRDSVRMEWILQHFHPDILYNAAAYKHVPLVEENPAEGVKTNVLGTCGLAALAAEAGVRRFVQISTDKAVNPANVMGATKRVAEIYCQNLDARTPETAFITTRFGNVLGSAGSVVPLFTRQIASGGPVTVTHPLVTRYFMTIPEAVALILHAGAMGQGGEIFVLDMGESVKIVDLAEKMIRLSGLEPGRDITIEFCGLRPGEKLYEELFHDDEALLPTEHTKIRLAASRQVEWAWIEAALKELGGACCQRDVAALHRVLHRIVPEMVN